MITLHKKLVIDENGKSREVIICWKEYKEVAELLGLDLDQEAINDLKVAKKDRRYKKKGAYVELDNI